MHARTNRWMDRLTHDEHNAMTVVCWPLASGANREKMTFYSQWLVKCDLGAVRRELWCHDMLPVCQKYEDQYTYYWLLQVHLRRVHL